ncbi:NUDIX domain-containing protein [Paenibacillus sp. sgz500958]|uniref:NUDIX hydrolase n=1 Tax=Paenibacillus sp. sgz500958 TaxID=3242475 RepID=UPI0036D2F315
MVNKRSLVVVVKGVILNNGRILLVQRAMDDPIGAGNWESAGGKLEHGEELEAAITREIMEETGLEVEVGTLLYATTMMTEPGRQVVFLNYICRTGNSEVYLSSEHMDFRWCTQNQARALLNPQIIAEFEKYNIFGMEGWV